MSVTVTIESRPIDKNIDWNIMGGDNRNLTWEEYLSEVDEPYKEHFIALKKCIEDSEFYRSTGEIFCNYHYFLFSDGIICTFSWRAWGDIMQALVGKREGYMTYYM